MSNQYPDDFPEDHKAPPPPPEPTAKEVEESKRKAFIQYAEDVASNAKEYVDGIK